MSAGSPPGPPAATTPPAVPVDRLESWKEVAAYLKRDVTTVQRWERREGMPVHRHVHDKLGSVYAFRSELDAWARGRSAARGGAEREAAGAPELVAPAAPPSARRRRRLAGIAVVAALVAGMAVGTSLLRARGAGESPLASARFRLLTDFDGIEQAAAISSDGRFVAFQSDRDGRMDVWVTQLGTGQFLNLTRGAAPELVNPFVRTLGFSPDGTLVTFWVRGAGSGGGDIGIWAAPLLGGAPRPYLENVAELDWSADGSRLVFHTPGPGDPTFVRGADPRDVSSPIFTAPAGQHAHFPIWSPDRAFVYFVLGALPDHLDLWRVPAAGGAPERITRHDAAVSHPVFLDGRTLLYLVADEEGFARIHVLDVERRASRPASFGPDRYTSLAGSADGRRLVATLASPSSTLWRVALDGGRADIDAACHIALTTRTAASPRLGPGFLVYVSSKGPGDGVWKLRGGAATELWSAPDARVLGAPAVSRDGRRIAFSAREGGKTRLHVVDADGSGGRVVAEGLALQGGPAWTPDGEALAVAAQVGGVPHLFRVALGGGAPEPLVTEHAVDPVWSPGGDLLAFSGADVGTRFPVRLVRTDGGPPADGPILTRGARHLAFLPGGRALLVLRGEIRHKNLWRVDLDTGAERQVTDVPPDFDLRDFDVSPDGKELVLERAQERSNVVLVERPTR